MVDERPVNGRAWGEWLSGGNNRWDIVGRSWSVFARNTSELVTLLNIPAADIGVALLLMGDDRAATAPYWDELDQRLHNQTASVASLVDHVRGLLNYYRDDVPDVVAEYEARNATIVAMSEAALLRDLRNYLLHCGAPPILQTQLLGGTRTIKRGDHTGHLVKLSATSLLTWDGWKAPARRYLKSFADRDGPVLGRDVSAYATAMSTLFTWLFAQRQVIRSREVPGRFRID